MDSKCPVLKLLLTLPVIGLTSMVLVVRDREWGLFTWKKRPLDVRF